MNEYDTQRIISILNLRGMLPARSSDEADLVILNTCSVREKPEHKVSSVTGQLRAARRKTGAPLKIGIMGCVAQQVGSRYLKINKNVDFVLGTDGLSELNNVLDRVENGERIAYTDWSREEFSISSFERENSVSSLVTIMKGCNNFCSYCIVPYVRGREKSRKPDEIISEIVSLAKSGITEVTLLGQNVNSYGYNSDYGVDFPELLEMAAGVEGIKRLRFLTSHPKDFSRKMAEVIARNKNICPNIHLPLQSGSNKILKSMNRNYTVEDYLEKISIAKELIDGVEFSSDFIVGFPGETLEDYNQTLNIIKELEYETIFVFNYSVRPGTKAEKFTDDVLLEEKTRRLQEINKVQEEITRRRFEKISGTSVSVMVTGKRDGVYSGRTIHNRVVNFTSGVELELGCEVGVLITEPKRNSLFGKYREIQTANRKLVLNKV